MAVAIVSEKISEPCRATLAQEGFFVLPCPSSRYLPAPIAHHPDMQMVILGKSVFCHEGYLNENAAFFSELSALFPHIQVVGLPDAPGKNYPLDCAYNLLKMGEKAFYNPKGLSPALAHILSKNGLYARHTRQGYTACTVRALGERHAITADLGMAAVLTCEGISVLTVGEGHIALPPYAHGFIGGASGCFGRTVYFLGDISTHPDYERMECFAKEAGFSLRSLSGEPLCDLGGILFIE